MNYRFTLALVVFALVAWPASAQLSVADFGPPEVSGTPIPLPYVGSTVLVDQAPDQINGLFSDADCNVFCGSGAQVLADNFVQFVPPGQDIIFLAWAGAFFPADEPLGTGVFDINFYADVGGLPDATMACSLSGLVPNSALSGLVLFGVQEVIYTLALDQGPPGDCNLFESQTPYWIEIYNTSVVVANDWFWETGAVGPGTIPGKAFATTAPGTAWSAIADEQSLAVISDDKIPVELVSFNATTSGTDISLNWETSSETNNAGFEVQVQNGESWNALGFVDGHGTTTEAQTYNYSADMGVGTHTFRLKQIDFDGAFEYSDELEVSVETPGSHVLTSAYPNPFNPQSQFTLAVAQDQVVTAELYNTLGQRVATLFSGTVEANQAQQITIDGAGLASGMYVVRVNGERFNDALSVTLLK